MRRFIMCIVLMLLFIGLGGCGGKNSTASPDASSLQRSEEGSANGEVARPTSGYDTDEWQMFGQRWWHWRRSPANLPLLADAPVEPDIGANWVSGFLGEMVSSPSVSENQELFVTSKDGALHCLAQDGSWLGSTSSAGTSRTYSSPACVGGGTVYYTTSDGFLRAVTWTGSAFAPKWAEPFSIGGTRAYCSPVVVPTGADAGIYIGTHYGSQYVGELYKIVDQGDHAAAAWPEPVSFGYGLSSTPAVRDGHIYLVIRDASIWGKLHRYSTLDGQLEEQSPSFEWQTSTTDGLPQGLSSPAISQAGQVFVCAKDTLRRYLPTDFSQFVEVYDPGNWQAAGSPAIARAPGGGSEYIVSCWNDTYNDKWRVAVHTEDMGNDQLPRWISAEYDGQVAGSPAVDDYGNVYICTATALHIFHRVTTANPFTEWEHYWDSEADSSAILGDEIWSSPTIDPLDPSGLSAQVYVATRTGYVFAFGRGGSQNFDTPWPMFGKDSAHHWNSDMPGPSSNDFMHWESEAASPVEDGRFWTTPAISYDGSAYLVTSNGMLYGFEWVLSPFPQLVIKDGFPVPGDPTESYWNLASPALSPLGTVYHTIISGENSVLRATNPDGSVAWTFGGNPGDDFEGEWGYSSPTVGPDGRVYVGTYTLSEFGVDELYSITPSGGLSWKSIPLGPIASSPAISPANGLVYIMAEEPYDPPADAVVRLHAFDPDNGPMYSRPPVFTAEEIICRTHSSITVTEDGWVLASDTGVLYLFDPQLSLKDRISVGRPEDAWQSPAIDNYGRIYMPDCYLNGIRAFNIVVDGEDAHFEEFWHWAFPKPVFLPSAPIFNVHNGMYIKTRERSPEPNFYYFRYNGNPGSIFYDSVTYSIPLDMFSSTGLALGADSKVYVGSMDGILVAVDDLL